MALALITTTTGSSYLTPGPVSVSPRNARGNLLVVFAAWTTATAQTSGSPLVPAVAVADDQGNWWRQAADSGNAMPAARTAVWVCSNALPIQSWLSVCPQGNFSSLWFAVAEFSGALASYWPQIDFGVSSTVPWGSTSQSLTAVLSQADYLFSITCAGTIAGQSVSITPPSAGWTSIASGSVEATFADGLAAAAVFGPFSAGTEAVSYSYNSGVPAAMCVVGLSQQSYLPVQPNVDFPLVVVESAFGSTPGDPSQATLESAWTDISTYALTRDGDASITATRGRQYELATPESGVLTIALNNLDGEFNPTNQGSSFYSNALNQNMAFFTSIAPWTARNVNGALSWTSAVTFASGNAAIGNGVMEITPNGSGSSPGAISEFVAINPNYEYAASCWFMCPAGWASGAAVNIGWYTSGQSLISTSSGTAVPLLASTWTQATVTGQAPVTAAFARITLFMPGTPSSSNFTYASEAGLALGSSLQAGLIRQGTPVRVSAYWQGRRYAVAYGLAERWPQTWPDFSQWTWSELTATDIAGAASVNLPSAVQGEITTCLPYACFPFSEQYSTSSNTINGTVLSSSECDGQIAVNTAPGNQRPAVYIDGNEPVETGSSLNFLGDSGTGMGANAYSTYDLSGERGPGAQYGPDYSLPALAPSGAGDVTIEMWWTVPDFTLPSPTIVTTQLWQILVQPDLASNGIANLAQGCLICGGIFYPTGTPPVAYIQPSWSGTIVVHNDVLLTAGMLVHNIVIIQNGTAFWYVNDVVGSVVSGPTSGNLYSLAFGLCTSVTGTRGAFSGNFNYSLAYGTLYSYAIGPARVRSHYNSGTNGFTGDTVLQRAARYVAWGGVNVGLAGPVVSEAPTLGPAYDTAGTQMSAALNADSESAGSRWGGTANGNLVVVPRTASYNEVPSVTFGDSPQGPLNGNSQFSSGTAGWSAINGAALSLTSGILANSGKVLVITPNGSTASPGVTASAAGNAGSSFIPVPASQVAVSSCLVMSPQGWASGAVTIISWYTSGMSFISSSTSNAAQLAAGTWTYIELVATAPANAAYAQLIFEVVGTPGSAVKFSIDSLSLQLQLDQVPYQKGIAFDYDNTYIQNSAQATLTSGPSTLAAPIVRDQQSVTEYLQRGPLSQSVSGQFTEDAYDRATWSLFKYRQPSMRVSSITVQPNSYPQAFTSVLTTDIGDIASVSRFPTPGPGYTLPVVTEQVSIEIGPGGWQVSYQQSPYEPDGTILTADTAGYNVLGSNTLAW